ncbi:hypothetical protein LIER_17901 [Lithospermum erythrorhizon]|uniref:Uncharacterized protein n=1 Tax=Lithospermum erythrorhizon TaxID=34254 RepID=A0AAV3QC20_LITER
MSTTSKSAPHDPNSLPPAPEGPSTSQKRERISSSNSSSGQPSKEIGQGPHHTWKPTESMGHEELISSLSNLGRRVFDLQEGALYAYKGLLASYEEASGSSSHISQLEQEMNELKKCKVQEESVLQRHLKNLVGDHESLKERYASNVRKTDSLVAELERVKVERNYA